ncbi:MAG: hypothetical protein GY768_31055, partial [Planctomycetaceae bacterium]|nr:hypothetical protein [Planctomycetaceae bacterium]
LIEQFARIGNFRGLPRDDLYNHTYAVMFDHMITLRDEHTLGGQVETRSEHSTASFIECIAGIAFAHVTKGMFLDEDESGIIEVEPADARQYLDEIWRELRSMGFEPEMEDFVDKPRNEWCIPVNEWAKPLVYRPRAPIWWSDPTMWKKVAEQMKLCQSLHDHYMKEIDSHRPNNPYNLDPEDRENLFQTMGRADRVDYKETRRKEPHGVSGRTATDTWEDEGDGRGDRPKGWSVPEPGVDNPTLPNAPVVYAEHGTRTIIPAT